VASLAFSLEFVGRRFAGFECAFEVDDDAFQFFFFWEVCDMRGSRCMVHSCSRSRSPRSGGRGFRPLDSLSMACKTSGLRPGLLGAPGCLRDVFVRAGAVDPPECLDVNDLHSPGDLRAPARPIITPAPRPPPLAVAPEFAFSTGGLDDGGEPLAWCIAILACAAEALNLVISQSKNAPIVDGLFLQMSA